MKTFLKLSCLFILFSNGYAASEIIAEYHDEATGHTLIFREGSGENDQANAKQFYKNFFKLSHKENPEFNSADEFIEKNFELYNPFILNKTYKFIIVENKESKEMCGYALFDISPTDKEVTFIECQADIFTYPIKSLMPVMVSTIKNYASFVDKIYSMVPKTHPHYGEILESCGYTTCPVLHASIENPAEYYNKPELNNPLFTNLKNEYTGFVFHCN